jgi:hypothetical protein
MRGVLGMGFRVSFVVFLPVFAASANVPDAALPWSFVNGSAKGYSIQLVSASPVPGSKVSAGQTVAFEVSVSYQLSIADKGAIVLYLEDANNQNLSPGKAQQSHIVNRGEGTLTITESFVVPTGPKEVRLFIPLVPRGLEHTDGELVLRYPVSYEAKSNAIGYPSVSAALADLHSKPEVKFHEDHRWIIAEDSRHYTYWSFPPADNPAYPSAIKRTAVNDAAGVSMRMEVLCESTPSACDKLVRDFEALNQP